MLEVIKFLPIFSIIAKKAGANPIACPMCAVAIASGLGLSRALGVSDTVIGIWTGAMLLALSHGLITYLKKKNINNKWLNVAIYTLTYFLIIPLYIGEKSTLIFNLRTILGIDEFLFSVIAGSVALFVSSKLYYSIKEKNGKPHFPYEKVVLPVTVLLIISLLFQFLGAV